MGGRIPSGPPGRDETHLRSIREMVQGNYRDHWPSYTHNVFVPACTRLDRPSTSQKRLPPLALIGTRK